MNLIELLLEIARLQSGCHVLDVGCGVGGTSRYLAKERDCCVTGITISAQQVAMANRLSMAEQVPRLEPSSPSSQFAPITLSRAGGSVTFQELDAELLGAHFHPDSFDVVWITEALSHFPNKPLFFENAYRVLQQGGKLVLADWFKDANLNEQQMKADINPIEDGMLLPSLCTMQEYVRMAEDAGLRLRKTGVGNNGFKDISKNVAKTWCVSVSISLPSLINSSRDISWSLVQSPSLWAFAAAQGRDGLAFLQSFRAMRRGYANGTFRYAVMSFEKQI